ncbi:acetyl-CoA acetyltransferase [Pseudomonas sp. W15-Feb18]|nr:acetyl-CoA acetyltransferase [Pseudomonas arcuscaelestis]
MPFTPIGSRETPAALAAGAVQLCLADACIDFELIDQIFAANAHSGTAVGEHAMRSFGLTGTPLVSIGDGEMSGYAAFHLARQCVLSGEAECVLAVGCEALPSGSAGRTRAALDAVSETDGENLLISQDLRDLLVLREFPEKLYAAQMSALQALLEGSAAVSERVLAQAHRQARLNPHALLHGGQDYPGEGTPYLCPPANGAAAVLLCSPEFARRYGLRTDVASLASVRGSNSESDLQSLSVLDVLGRAATRRVACQAYEQAGVGPEEIDVVELHDHSLADFLIGSAALGFCSEAQLDSFSRGRHAGEDGRVAICSSGGLLGRGHAPGASGLAQLAELVWQLRGDAGARQVKGARIALQHSSARGRAVSVGILQRMF